MDLSPVRKNIEKNTVDEKQSKKKKGKCCDCFARVASTTAPPITAALETSKDIIIPSGVSRLPYIKHKIHAIKVPRHRPSSTSGRCFMCTGGNDIRFSWPCRLAGWGWGGWRGEEGNQDQDLNSVAKAIKSDSEDGVATQSWSRPYCNLINPSGEL